MSEEKAWQTENAAYLSTALAWLHGRLERHAERSLEPLVISAETLQEPVQPELPAPQTPKRRGGRREPAKPTEVIPADTSTAVPKIERPEPVRLELDGLARLAAELADAEAHITAPPALIMLSRRLGLSQFEREVLLLCAAIELDPRIASLCALAQNDPARPYPTFALAFLLFDAPAWDALSPERPLRYWRLLEISQPGGQPLTSSPLRADERIVSYIKGLNYMDDRLSTLVGPLTVHGFSMKLPPSQELAVERIVNHLQRFTQGEGNPVIQLLGVDTPSKHLVATRAAHALGLHLYRLPTAMLPTQPAELETLSRLWQRESMLLPLALYVDATASDVETPQPGTASPVIRLLSRLRGIVFVDTREGLSGLMEDGLSVDVAKPTPHEQKEAWAAALGEASGAAPAQLASQFNLSLVVIDQIARRAESEAAGSGSSLHHRLWDACLATTRPRLDALAQRVDARATWHDLVLPPAETALLRQLAAQVAHRGTVHDDWGFGGRMTRGLGISALFAGDSGTGKTMAAEVIANELRLNLYRIDLSAVVNKYIGETEKNLRRLFDAAEDGGAILFFDEADALFGKRSEVKDSLDRYSNIEINYLLQRMEAYGGLAILATNRQSALDQAFMRRLRFVVNFPFPSAAQRKAMWQKVFPEQTPTHELDMDRLSRLNLTGGNITGIALNAAFQAAQTGEPVTMPMIVESARAELRKLGRVINELEFRSAGKGGRAA
jgi:hypothetical protein